jgi:AraC family transcriptional regulator
MAVDSHGGSQALEAGAYFGTVVRTCSVTGVRFTESAYEAGQVLPTHDHASATMCFVMQGAFDEDWGGSRMEFSRGMLLYRPAGHIHSDRFTAPNSVTLSIDLSHELAAAGPNEPKSIKSPTTRSIVSRLCREIRHTDECSPLAAESLTHLLQDELARLPDEVGRRPPRWLLRVKARLHEDIRTTPSLAELAEIAKAHPMHVTRRFNQFFGCSIGEYLRTLRVEHCRRLLAQTDRPIGEISFEGGFCDQAYFTRTFRAAVGCPPAEYRRRARGGGGR